MRAQLAGLFAAVVGFGTAQAQTPAPAPSPALDAYAKPARLVKLADGRRIHLNCQGKGGPTVILTAGLGAWSVSWWRVHAEIAKHARTCSWDRAGFGHSDPSPAPQTLDVTTADLEQAMAAGGIKGPYVLVGHSAGAFETLRFADRHRGDVVGMVLVDPSAPEQIQRFVATVGDVAARSDAGRLAGVGVLKTCARDLEAGTLTADAPQWKLCFPDIPSFTPALTAAMRALDATPARLRTQASLNEGFGASASAVADPSRNYGDLPLIVLTQGAGLALPGSTAEQTTALTDAWIKWHDDYAKLSTRGVNLIVRGAGHGIQRDKPQAVIGAVDAVLAQARRR